MHSKYLLFYTFFFLAVLASPAWAQSLSEFMESQNKPSSMKHIKVEQSDQKPEKSSKVSKDPLAVDKDEALENAQRLIKQRYGNPSTEEQQGYSYQGLGLTLTDEERFPSLSNLSEWPWIREMTYGPENPATLNALHIMDRDLAKVSPLALMWAAQHYHDMGKKEKALFMYLASRLRSSVDQARFATSNNEKEAGSNKDEDQPRTSSSKKTQTSDEDPVFKQLVMYNAIASSIGRSILKYGLRNPELYQEQLNYVMLWDSETPYEYLPSVTDLTVNEDRKNDWEKNYQSIRKLYFKQMNKIAQALKN